MKRNQWPCLLCDKLHPELEAAERCEREHEAAHDAYCGCRDCTRDRCMPEEMSHE